MIRYFAAGQYPGMCKGFGEGFTPRGNLVEIVVTNRRQS